MALLTSDNADPRSTPEYQSVASQIPQSPCFGTSQDICTPPQNGTENPPFHQLSVSGEVIKVVLPPGKTVQLFARLRCGRISKEDILHENPGFVVPDYVLSDLKKKWEEESNAELVIWLDEKGECVCQVDTAKNGKGWQQFVILQPDEEVILQTRIKFGAISYDAKKSGVVYRRYPDWTVPARAEKALKEQYRWKRNAELIGILNSKKELRFVVIDGNSREEWPQRYKIV